MTTDSKPPGPTPIRAIINRGLLASIVMLAGSAQAQVQEQLARDALSQLDVMYAPAKTRFALARPATDRFGVLFVAALHDKGYMLQPAADATALELDYLIDQPAPGVYRLSLSVAGKTLARTFVKQGNSATGVGRWTEDEVPSPRNSAALGTVPSRATLGDSERAPFSVTSSDTLLVPLLVRWAQSDGLVPVLNGRRVTTRTLREEAYSDLPLTSLARSVTGVTAAQAITKILETYSHYRVNLEVEATVRSNNFLAITTRKPASSVMPAQFSPPVVAATGAGNFPRVPPPPAIVATAAVIPEPTWDRAARKAAGVVRGTWHVGQSPSLRSIVEEWAAQSGYRVEWTARQDPLVTEAVRAGMYTGTFSEALMRLASAFGEFKSPLGMTLNAAQGAQVLRVFDI